MAKVIKRSSTNSSSGDGGDINPVTGFSDERSVTRATPLGGNKVVKKDRFEARKDAESIRDRAHGTATGIVEQAEAEAAEIMAQAQADAEQLKTDAHAQGLAEGRAQGAAELSEVVATSAQRLQAIEAQAIPQLKELAMGIVRKILGRELEFHPDAVVDIVRQALSEKARQRREIFLRVNPQDMEILRDARGELVEVLSRCKEIGLREDPNVKRHGVIIETDAGIIDAQLDSQLQIFERILMDH